MTTQMTYVQWHRNLLDWCEPVGDCVEWQGPTLKAKTPLVYVPKGFVLPQWGQYRQSARVVLWALFHGAPPPAGSVLRVSCCNDKCVAIEHMFVMTRAKAPVEQAKRGELSTPKRKAAAIRRARSRETKLSVEKAREIRSSCESSTVLAPRYGVSKATINAVRRGKAWPEAANGASVFNWRPAA
ncbi:MAG: hypothetical protein EOP35_01745 [Rubrivivax sp.]|nr:MAG: hypothetical protein EOP35_01745 [Rubrivivax sp.]